MLFWASFVVTLEVGLLCLCHWLPQMTQVVLASKVCTLDLVVTDMLVLASDEQEALSADETVSVFA